MIITLKPAFLLVILGNAETVQERPNHNEKQISVKGKIMRFACRDIANGLVNGRLVRQSRLVLTHRAAAEVDLSKIRPMHSLDRAVGQTFAAPHGLGDKLLGGATLLLCLICILR
jgi:hypothetical protein